jgi:hypothetical protein
MRVRLLAGLTLAGILAGCATSPTLLKLAMTSSATIKTMRTPDLCDAWVASGDERFLYEVHSRQLFDERDDREIMHHEVHVGMPVAAAECSWGTRHTVESDGGSTRWLYAASGSLIVTRDGAVTSFRN